MQKLPEQVASRLKHAVGEPGIVERPADMAPYLADARGIFQGQAEFVLRPANTGEVAAVVSICAEAGVGIVPQGGNTGFMGGCIPNVDGGEVLVSLGRMNRVRDIDVLNYTMTAEAGCVLSGLHSAAAEAGRLFPLRIGSEGTCQLGGNLSTNAGGTAVLRYGNARDLVLGLEVLLPGGQVWDGLRRLRKDNRGYDLKHCFLGAEGTLGIVTAAVLKLFPIPEDTSTAFVAVPDVAAATALLANLRARSGDLVCTFEYMHRECLDLVFAHIDQCRDPFADRHEHYILLEFSGSAAHGGASGALELALEQALELGLVVDATLSSSGAQTEQLWRLRENITVAQQRVGGSIKHDVSVPVSQVGAFLTQATRLSQQTIPGVRVIPFGHLGDGNIHFNLSQPEGSQADEFLSHAKTMSARIYELVDAMDGSISAEHGIGQKKRGELRRYKSTLEIELMQKIKDAFDPRGIMNPGKVL